MEIVLTLLVLGIGILLWRSFLPAYTSEKGKNLATKEDIAAITKEVKRVESFYANQLTQLEHRLRSRQELRMVAVEKRLEVHQQAYTLWRKLRSNVFSKDIASIVIECQEWWERNCLYLAPEAREAFLQAYFAAADHSSLLAAHVPGDHVHENYQIMMKAGKAIVSGVQLPTLGEREAEDVMDKTRPSQSDVRSRPV